MLLTLLLHMNLINDLSHLSLAQWVGRPTNVWHPLARDITNITSSSTHYIPIEISQWCIFFPLEAPGSSLQSYPTLLQGEWLEWRHWFPFPRAKRAGATPKKGKRCIPVKITERHASLGYKRPFVVFSTFDCDQLAKIPSTRLERKQ